jgi:hypothetical protein
MALSILGLCGFPFWTLVSVGLLFYLTRPGVKLLFADRASWSAEEQESVRRDAPGPAGLVPALGLFAVLFGGAGLLGLMGVVGLVALGRMGRPAASAKSPPPRASLPSPRERSAGALPRAPSPTPSPLVVIADHAELEAARDLAGRRDEDTVKRFFAELADAQKPHWSVYESTIRLLKRRGAKTTESLRSLAGDGSRPAVLRMRAAHTLIRLRDPQGWATALALLAAAEGRSARDLLRLVPVLPSEARVTSEVSARLEAFLDASDPELALTAMRLRLQAGPSPQPRHLAILEKAAGAEPPPSAYVLRAALEEFVRASDGSLRSRGLRLLERTLRAQEPGPFALVTYARHADAAAVPFLQEQLGRKDASGRLTYDRGAVLQALARLKAPGARDAVLAQLETKEAWIAVEPLAVLGAGTGDEALLERLRAACSKQGTSMALSCCRAMARIGGPRAPALARELASSLTPGDRVEVEAELKGVTVEKAWQELAAMKLVSPGFPADYDREEAESRGLHGKVKTALEAAGQLLWFDTETGYLPVPHDELVERFGAASLGAFRPEAAFETWHSPEKGERVVSDLEPRVPGQGYTVQFVHGGRLYRFHAEDRGDWYDVGSVVAAVNRALADAGRSERFSGLHTGGQDAAYLFGAPSAVEAAAERGLLVLDPSDAAARERGKAFEQKALESLRGR